MERTTTMIEIDRDRFTQLREQMGVLSAREQCVREAVQRAIDQAENMEQIKCILLTIVKQIRFDK
jgi:hypothetical protein